MLFTCIIALIMLNIKKMETKKLYGNFRIAGSYAAFNLLMLLGIINSCSAQIKMQGNEIRKSAINYVQLLGFEASAQSNNVVIKWASTNESDHSYYFLEKSVDGISFQEVARVNGGTCTSSVSKFTAIDRKPLKGISFYRLKHIDRNGMQQLFNAIAFSTEANEKVNQDPQASISNIDEALSDLIQIHVKEETQIEVIDRKGVVIYKGPMPAAKEGAIHQFMKNSKIMDGVYILKVVNNDEIKTRKIYVSDNNFII